MYTALVVTWKVPFPGREAKALEYGLEVEDFWGKAAAEGLFTTPEWFFFPDGTGMWMVKGDFAELEKFFYGPDAQLLITKGMYLLEDFKWAFTFAGETATEFMTRYGAVGKELALF